MPGISPGIGYVAVEKKRKISPSLWSFPGRGERLNKQRDINAVEKSKAEGKRKCWGRGCNLERAKGILEEKVTFKQGLTEVRGHRDMGWWRRGFLAGRKTNAQLLRTEHTWRVRGPAKDQQGWIGVKRVSEDSRGSSFRPPACRLAQQGPGPFSGASPLSHCGPWSSHLAIGDLGLNPYLDPNSHRPRDLFWPRLLHRGTEDRTCGFPSLLSTEVPVLF